MQTCAPKILCTAFNSITKVNTDIIKEQKGPWSSVAILKEQSRRMYSALAVLVQYSQ